MVNYKGDLAEQDQRNQCIISHIDMNDTNHPVQYKVLSIMTDACIGSNSFYHKLHTAYDKYSDPDSPKSVINGTNCTNKATIAVTSEERKSCVSPEELACTWRIDLETAKRTLMATIQLLVQSVLTPTLNQRYSKNDRMLRYPRANCNIFMDTFFCQK